MSPTLTDTPTTGPWSVANEPRVADSPYYVRDVHDRRPPADPVVGRTIATVWTNEAHARLIAAAPALQAALRECHAALSGLRTARHYNGLGTIARAQNAIARAEGR